MLWGQHVDAAKQQECYAPWTVRASLSRLMVVPTSMLGACSGTVPSCGPVSRSRCGPVFSSGKIGHVTQQNAALGECWVSVSCDVAPALLSVSFDVAQQA